jgi:hypothetical protein
MIEAPVTLLRQHVYEGDSYKGKRTNVSLCLYKRKSISLLGISKYVTKKKMHQENKYTLMIHFPKNLTFLMSLSCLPFIYPIPPLSSFLNCISDESEKHPKQYMALIGLNHR